MSAILVCIFATLVAPEQPQTSPPAEAGEVPPSPQEVALRQRIFDEFRAECAKQLGKLNAEHAESQRDRVLMREESRRLDAEHKLFMDYAGTIGVIFQADMRLNAFVRRSTGFKLPVPAFLLIPLPRTPAIK